MRILLSAALASGALLPFATSSSVVVAADLDYEYGTPPQPHLYERRSYVLPPPFIDYEAPLPRSYQRGYSYDDGYQGYAEPYYDRSDDFDQERPRRPRFADRPY